jgi:hypothetical protein
MDVLRSIVQPPPNLKVWAERKYTIEAGNNQGETPEYLIGYEGAGEADDTVIQIYTDWIEICVGSSDEVCETTTTSIQGLNLVLAPALTGLAPGQTTMLTATVTTPSGSPVANVPVSFTATKGGLQENDVVTDANGIAQVKFTAGLNPSQGTWTAQVGYAASTQVDFVVRFPSGSGIDASETILLADESSDGQITFDLLEIPGK